MSQMLTDWLESRSLDPELAAKMGWAFAQHRELGPSVRIPYYRDGKVVTVQYRSLERKEFRFAKNSEIELWNVDCLKDVSLCDAPLVIAEGACDGLALMQCGYPRVVAVPGWSDKNSDPSNYEPFKRNEGLICNAGEFLVAQHADNTGATMLRATANFFEGSDVGYVRWPEGCKDANDTLHLHGAEAVVRALNQSKSVDPPGGRITGFSDLPPRPERRVWRLDYPEVDKLMAFRSRAVSVLTGTPGAGKTTFMTWAAHHLVRANGVRVGMALFETEPYEVLLHLARLHGKEPDYMTEADWDELKAKLDKDYRILHREEFRGDEGKDTAGHSLLWVKQMIHKLAARDHCGIIIIDPWNELEHLPEPGESMTSYINFSLTRMRQWAEKYDVHICIVAHPRKMQAGERPTGYHISDSAAWANKPDMGWTISIERGQGEEPEHVLLSNWKVRSRQGTGCRPGAVKLTFEEQTMIYRPMRRN